MSVPYQLTVYVANTSDAQIWEEIEQNYNEQYHPEQYWTITKLQA